MNAMFNPVDFIRRLESEGLSRGAAETIAQSIDDRNNELATKADLATFATNAGLEHLATRLEQSYANLVEKLGQSYANFAEKIELNQATFATKLELERVISRQTLQFGIMLGARLAIAVAAIGVIVALFH